MDQLVKNSSHGNSVFIEVFQYHISFGKASGGVTNGFGLVTRNNSPCPSKVRMDRLYSTVQLKLHGLVKVQDSTSYHILGEEKRPENLWRYAIQKQVGASFLVGIR